MVWMIFQFLGLSIFTPKRNVVVNAQSIFVPFKNVSLMPEYLNMLIWGIFDAVNDVLVIVVVVFVVDTLQLMFKKSNLTEHVVGPVLKGSQALRMLKC